MNIGFLLFCLDGKAARLTGAGGHLGSMSVDCRTRMEIEATQEAVRFVSGQQLLNSVPPEEYEVQRQSE